MSRVVMKLEMQMQMKHAAAVRWLATCPLPRLNMPPPSASSLSPLQDQFTSMSQAMMKLEMQMKQQRGGKRASESGTQTEQQGGAGTAAAAAVSVPDEVVAARIRELEQEVRTAVPVHELPCFVVGTKD